ncbi:energy-coupling factor transport system ATP-binding protein [Nocardioides massiliensis]|uniref:Energy-coupling factor transport system ATP-binding protein n=3 Tax=Nocardioides massiliensis TaxID=1325935 RepID=A0ABT9NTM0_9ACTN|nr:ATP-binding cassette domain-containing protein [Nocardioides massiliensis]MDP9823762.1 energy-coupling factor transport system ATP-binding protein [Nocardioides massiliensis]
MELRSCTFDYGEDTRPILDAVDLTVEEGELVVLAGRTGVGKSTLLGLVNGLVPKFTGGRFRGDVLIDGASVMHLPPRERAHLVGYVGQDPAAGFVTDTVEEELAYGMEQLGYDPATMRRRVEETLDLLGIPELRARDLRTLSGGQQQRVAIGSVLTTHPRMLVLDEPTSALDPTAAEDVLATLTRLVHDLGVSVLLAEHRLERVVPFADRMAVLRGDGSLEVGDPREVLLDSPVAPPLVELGRALGWSPLPLSVREARRAARGLTERLTPPVVPETAAGKVSVRTRRLTVAYGDVVAVRDVDLELHAGSVTCLMGRNGSGKSTLLWTLQGSTRRTAGSVTVAGDDPATLSAAERRARFGLVPQTAADLLYLETVAEECATADRHAEASAGTCRALLERLVPGIDPEAHPRDLSEGQRLSLVLAIVLTSAPGVVALDEPTRGLDYPAKSVLATVLRELADDGRTVVVATHDVEFVAAVADRTVVLAEGQVVSAGPTAKVAVESPAFAPQTVKVLGPAWLTVDQVRTALDTARG